MHKLLPLYCTLLVLVSANVTSAQDGRTRLTRPVMVGAEPASDACPGIGSVRGLDPRRAGDSLAVKSGPGLSFRRIDKLQNGQRVYVCQQIGDWYGIVYTKDRLDCRVSLSGQRSIPYVGPCRSGWSHRRWIGTDAG